MKAVNGEVTKNSEPTSTISFKVTPTPKAYIKVDGIKITERKNHMMYPEYVEPSLDATVVWQTILQK